MNENQSERLIERNLGQRPKNGNPEKSHQAVSLKQIIANL